MIDDTLVTGAIRRHAALHLGEQKAERFLKLAHSQTRRAMREWDLEPLAPCTADTRNLSWLVQRGHRTLMLTIPVARGRSIMRATVALWRRGLGPEVIDALPESGTMLLEREGEGVPAHISYADGEAGAQETISRTLDLMSTIPAAAGSEPAERALRARLEAHTAQPGRSAAALHALHLLDRLEQQPHRRSFCHGKLDPRHVKRAGGRVILTGPRALEGDIHAELAAWTLRSSPEALPEGPAARRAAEAAAQLGWEPERAEAWTKVLHTAGVRARRHPHRP